VRQAPERAGDIEKGLVERQWLHLRRDRAKMAMTSLDTAAYTRCLGATNTARGHIR